MTHDLGRKEGNIVRDAEMERRLRRGKGTPVLTSAWQRVIEGSYLGQCPLDQESSS